MLIRLSFSLLSLCMATAASPSAQRLKAQAEAFAMSPVLLDERINIPECPSDYKFSRSRYLEASCVETGWRMSLPVRELKIARQEQAPIFQRGQVVHVYAQGAGYQIGIDAVVVSFVRNSNQVLVKNLRSGNQFMASANERGQLIAQFGL